MLPKNIIEAVAQQAREEYDFSFQRVEEKRRYFSDKFKEVMNIGKENKVYERLIFRMVDQMCALSHKFKHQVSFLQRGEEDTEAVRMLQQVQEFDYDEMNMGWKKYWAHWYKFIFGVRIEVGGIFDSFTGTPTYKVINPMSWVPDMAFDVNFGFRFHGFDLETTEAELENAKDFFDLEYLKDLKTLSLERTIEQQQTYNTMTQNRKLGEDTNDQKGVYGVYQHFTQYKGNWYEVWLGNDRQIPIYCKWLQPVLQEEKNNKLAIRPPVVVGWYRPLPNDPFGVSYAFDILSDKQRMKQELYNLAMIKAKEQVLGGKFLYDSDIVTADNVDVLTKAFTQNVYVPIPGLVTQPSVAVQEMPKSQIHPNTFDFQETLKRIVVEDTSMDERTMGVSAGPDITKAESERVQQNANIRLLLGANFDVEAEKEFYRLLWYREYVANKSKVKKKYIELTNGDVVTQLWLNAKDFITKADPRFKVVSILDKEEQKEKKKLAFNVAFNTLYQTATSTFGKNKLVKKYAELNDIDQEVIEAVYGGGVDEMQARLDLELIGKGIVPKIRSIDEDHETFIDIYQMSPNTETKMRAIFARQMAKMQRDAMQQEQQTQQTQEQPMSAGIENQAMSQQMNTAQSGATSLSNLG